MLRNLVEPLAAAAPLEHLTLLQGAKAYGVHLHPIRIPGSIGRKPLSSGQVGREPLSPNG